MPRVNGWCRFPQPKHMVLVLLHVVEYRMLGVSNCVIALSVAHWCGMCEMFRRAWCSVMYIRIRVSTC